jgi:hypothetical protein
MVDQCYMPHLKPCMEPCRQHCYFGERFHQCLKNRIETMYIIKMQLARQLIVKCALIHDMLMI